MRVPTFSVGSLQNAIELSAFTTSGFTVTSRNLNGGVHYGYLALNFSGTKTPFLQVINSPTAPGVVNHTTPAGEVPEFALMLNTLVQSVRFLENDADANGLSLGMFTTAQAGNVGIVVEDASNPTDTASFVSPAAVRLDSIVGTTTHTATVSAMTTGNLALNYSAASGVARKWILVGWSGTPVVQTLWTQQRQFTW